MFLYSTLNFLHLFCFDFLLLWFSASSLFSHSTDEEYKIHFKLFKTRE